MLFFFIGISELFFGIWLLFRLSFSAVLVLAKNVKKKPKNDLAWRSFKSAEPGGMSLLWMC